MITMLATFCHMATVGPNAAPIEFCQEQVVARAESTTEVCYVAAQQIIAARLEAGYRVKSIRCVKGNETPRNAI